MGFHWGLVAGKQGEKGYRKSAIEERRSWKQLGTVGLTERQSID